MALPQMMTPLRRVVQGLLLRRSVRDLLSIAGITGFLVVMACAAVPIKPVRVPLTPQAQGVTVWLEHADNRAGFKEELPELAFTSVTRALGDAGFSVSKLNSSAQLKADLVVAQGEWQLTLLPSQPGPTPLRASVAFPSGTVFDWSPERCAAAASRLVKDLVESPQASATLSSVRGEPQPRPTVASAPLPAPRATQRNAGVVAVLPVDSSSMALDGPTKLAFEEAVRTVAGDALSEHGFTVLTGETTLAVLADNNVDAQKACEASCALQAARELKARVFLSGIITKTEGDFVAFIRMFESTSGRQLASVQLEGDSVKALRKALEAKSEAFFRKGLAGLE